MAQLPAQSTCYQHPVVALCATTDARRPALCNTKNGCYRLADPIIPLSAKRNPAKRPEGCKQLAGPRSIPNMYGRTVFDKKGGDAINKAIANANPLTKENVHSISICLSNIQRMRFANSSYLFLEIHIVGLTPNIPIV